jgi:hypothetical protein
VPYITEIQRKEIADGRPPADAGELNYVLTLLAIEYFSTHGNYQGINDVVGALDGCKAEFQRRIVAPYEDGKISVNGDVYPLG